ncbi:MAG: hypothetical protein LBU06_12520 [Desulfovibrio sp.]|nr:hypothetical protein [Desulfovibrio sp.]
MKNLTADRDFPKNSCRETRAGRLCRTGARLTASGKGYLSRVPALGQIREKRALRTYAPFLRAMYRSINYAVFSEKIPNYVKSLLFLFLQILDACFAMRLMMQSGIEQPDRQVVIVHSYMVAARNLLAPTSQAASR